MNHELSDLEIETLRETMMDESVYLDLSVLFKMFADPTRLRIFSVLSKQTMRVDDLREILNMSHSAISHQLSSLRKLNLVCANKVGQSVYYSLADDHVMQIFKQALEHVLE